MCIRDRITADRSDIVTAGDVAVIHKPGLIMYAVASPMPPSNTYKNGKIGQGWSGFGKDLLITMAVPGGATSNDYPHRPFAPDEKCWVTGIQAQKDGILFQLYSDPYDNIRYYANLKIPFPNKKEIPPADAAMQLVAEVLTIAPQDNQDCLLYTSIPRWRTPGAPAAPWAAKPACFFIRKDRLRTIRSQRIPMFWPRPPMAITSWAHLYRRPAAQSLCLTSGCRYLR